MTCRSGTHRRLLPVSWQLPKCRHRSGGPSVACPVPGLLTDLPSELVAKSDGRFGAMGYAVDAHCRGQVESRTVVDQASVLSAQEEPFGDVEVRAPAVHERSSRLCGSSGRVGGIEHQAADAGFNKWREVPQGMPVDISRGDFVLVRLDTEGAIQQSIALCVERVTVVHFHAVTVGEEETIAGQHAAAIRGALLHSIVVRSLHEASKRLNRCFGSAGFLGKRGQRYHRASQK